MRTGILVTGAILIVFGVIGYVYPVTSVGSVSDIDDLCKSTIGSIGRC
ncbi:hypothetical protein [Candidatus Nitrosotalea okcheonensis]|uniref:Uncharacterized protein n=1 Tax=Candidatus Nitrosotalea okcheonensis TaxID=1903276 RepID=A0A2H1FF12_9ARCH|nr:hypothetical protein [Candidatus Nitrosotalea okcheonensis]SMH71331.1 exported protein of unknown function [Candidatus Nitrosotalea okcheonensis]